MEMIEDRIDELQHLGAGDEQCRDCLEMSMEPMSVCRKCIADTPEFSQIVRSIMENKTPSNCAFNRTRGTRILRNHFPSPRSVKAALEGFATVNWKKEWKMETRNKRVVNNLNEAISTMKMACEDAARALATGGDEVACQRVLHSLAWGFANASSRIETAMAAVQDAHEMQIEMLKPSNAALTRRP